MTHKSLLIVYPNGSYKADSLKQALGSLRPGKYAVRIEKVRKKRSHPQNNYYWGAVVKALAEEAGYEDWEVHENLKLRFLRSGKPMRVRSTTELNTLEFSEYVEKCVRLCAEMGILIPTPEEYYAMNPDAVPEA